MVLNTLFWYLIIGLAGWLAFPLAYRLLAFLPDRGLALARPLGLLLWGYAYWLLVSLHVLQNDTGGVLFALLMVGGLSAWQLRKGRLVELRDWLGARRKLVIVTELLFLALFVLWTVVRAADPAINSTEKPMELAFINSILRSPVFPPADPWLSGYAISYYYFGYVIVAALARLSGVPGAVAFNLALAAWFALTGLAAYGLVYNLLALRNGAASNRERGEKAGSGETAGQDQVENEPASADAPLFAPILAPLFVLIISNLEGFLEMLHARGLFWQQADGGWQSGFWSWLNIQEISQPPVPPFGWAPERAAGIWWWRASRVLQDFDWTGQTREIIDEFPAFSYLLGDLHPHVLSMPFVLLAAGLALNVYLRLTGSPSARLDSFAWLRSPDFWLTAIVLGGLSFLNTWDFPIYLALFAAAAVLPQFLRYGWRWWLAANLLEILVTLGLAGIVLYLPFYLGFASQAGGLLPSLIYFTRGAHLWVMFGSLLAPIIAWLLWKWRSARPAVGPGLLFAGGLVGGLWLLASVYGLLRLGSDHGLAGIYGAPPGAPLVLESLTRRLASPFGWLTLLALLTLTWGLLNAFRCRSGEAPQEEWYNFTNAAQEQQKSDVFVLLLVLLGAGLVLFPEFFYLRDQFGWRMNTIFKFYFQAWIVWAAAAAYASAVLWGEARGWGQFGFRAAWVALLAMALVYPIFGVWERTRGFQPTAWTLDGSEFLSFTNPGDLEAIRWLQDAPYGVVAEATSLRASYNPSYAKVATHTGLPTVLGWPGHESQWRGGAREIGSREPDIAQLYNTRDWEQARAILEKYNIRYVYLGSLERSQYRPNIDMFDTHLAPIYQNGTVTIYEVPQYSLRAGQATNP